ncbi:hypothetical protein [Aquimarina sp. 2201CG14-23]|uniref:hypothetical protein n=1 Tax=Aquimarina mycalae TaxID=3040073 RepID=UPI002477E841|nr:hypothetical protein [Aquimarina sp. 2201CG14-23]MDH7444069.1 hypothetical protein [Aquimarina sp. 2201CG14-23]
MKKTLKISNKNKYFRKKRTQHVVWFVVICIYINTIPSSFAQNNVVSFSNENVDLFQDHTICDYEDFGSDMLSFDIQSLRTNSKIIHAKTNAKTSATLNKKVEVQKSNISSGASFDIKKVDEIILNKNTVLKEITTMVLGYRIVFHKYFFGWTLSAICLIV